MYVTNQPKNVFREKKDWFSKVYVCVLFCEEDKSASTCPDTSLALLQTELAKVEEQSEVWSDPYPSISSFLGTFQLVLLHDRG